MWPFKRKPKSKPTPLVEPSFKEVKSSNPERDGTFSMSGLPCYWCRDGPHIGTVCELCRPGYERILKSYRQDAWIANRPWIPDQRILDMLKIQMQSPSGPPLTFVGPVAMTPYELYSEVRSGTEFGQQYHDNLVKTLQQAKGQKTN